MIPVSIIIPSYNREHLIGTAIDSCLKQSCSKLEIIVVDDCSEDTTADVVRAYGDLINLCVLPKNCGAQIARNEGMKLAKGKYIKFLDSDDYLEEGSLVDEVALAEQAHADIVVSGWGSVSIDGRRLKREPPQFGNGEEIVDQVLLGYAVHTSAALYRSEYLTKNRICWDPSLRKLQDWAFFAEAALNLGRIVRHDKLSYWLVAHQGPRLTDASMVSNARAHHQVLASLESIIEKKRLLTERRKQRLAEYHFKELQVLSRFDRSAFEKALVTINRLHPTLDPRVALPNRVFGYFAWLVGVRNALLLYAAYKNFSSADK